MSNGMVPSRSRRIGVASIILALVFLVAPVLGVQAQWGTGGKAPSLQAPIQSVSGAVLGTATFTWLSAGSAMVHIRVAGFNPVAGSHRVALSSVGRCISPFAMCSCNEVLVLPEMQFNADGSGEYNALANVSMDWLRQFHSLSIVIHADTNPDSAVIGCGVISGFREGPPPGPQPKPQPKPRPQPKPQPEPTVGHYRVTAALGLRLRSGPGLGYATRRIVPKGTVLENLGAEQWNGGILWAKVRAGGVGYWAAKTYLQAY